MKNDRGLADLLDALDRELEQRGRAVQPPDPDGSVPSLGPWLTRASPGTPACAASSPPAPAG